MAQCQDLSEQLFVFNMLGDDRAVKETWSAGVKVHERDNLSSTIPQKIGLN